MLMMLVIFFYIYVGVVVVVIVIKGYVLNQMVYIYVDLMMGEKVQYDGGVKVYGLGESWYEVLGCYYVRFEIVGDEEVIFVVNLVFGIDVLYGFDVNVCIVSDDFVKIGWVFIIDKDVEEQKVS